MGLFAVQIDKKEWIIFTVTHCLVVHNLKIVFIDFPCTTVCDVAQLLLVLRSKDDHRGALISNDLVQATGLSLEGLTQKEEANSNRTPTLELSNVTGISGQRIQFAWFAVQIAAHTVVKNNGDLTFSIVETVSWLLKVSILEEDE